MSFISGSKKNILDSLSDVKGFSNVVAGKTVAFRKINNGVPFKPASVSSAIDLDPNGGLELNPSDEIKIKLDNVTNTSSGLGLNSDGLRVSTDEPSGLDFDSGGIFVKTNEPSGLQTIVAGISIKLNESVSSNVTSGGSGIIKTSDGIRVPIIPRLPMLSIIRPLSSTPLNIPQGTVIQIGATYLSNVSDGIITYNQGSAIISIIAGYLFKLTAFFEMDKNTILQIRPQFRIDGAGGFSSSIWSQKKPAELFPSTSGMPIIDAYIGIRPSEGSFMEIRFVNTAVGGIGNMGIIGSIVNMHCVGEFNDGRGFIGDGM